MAPPKTLNFITGNKNKLTEVQAILTGIVDIQSQALDLVEIQGTVEEISLDKCRRAADAVSPFLSLWLLSHVIYVYTRSKAPYLLRTPACASTP